MFTNITETYLWDILRNSSKANDVDTSHMDYAGESRGQTQRYMILVSKLLQDLFSTTQDLYTVNDPHHCPEDRLDTVLYSIGLTYLPTNLPVNRKRELLKYYPIMVGTLGTKAFAQWMIWIILGWSVGSMTKELASNLVVTYDDATEYGEGVTLYANGQTLTYIMFDDSAAWVLTVIVPPSDPDGDVKKAWLASKLPEWLLSSKLQYQ